MIEYIKIPKYCPICREETIIKNNDGVKTLWCNNQNCESKLVNRIDHYLGKKTLKDYQKQHWKNLLIGDEPHIGQKV